MCTHPDRLRGRLKRTPTQEESRRGEIIFNRASTAREDLLKTQRGKQPMQCYQGELELAVLLFFQQVGRLFASLGLEDYLGFFWESVWAIITFEAGIINTLLALLWLSFVYKLLRQFGGYLWRMGILRFVLGFITTVVIGPIPTVVNFFFLPFIRIFVFLDSLRGQDRQEEQQSKKSDDPPVSGEEKKSEPQQPSTANIKLESDKDRNHLRQRKKKDNSEDKDTRNKELVNEEVNATDDSSGAPVTANGQLKPKPMPEGLWKIVTWSHKEQVKARQAAASAMQFDLLLILTKPVIPLFMLVATGQATGQYEVRAFVRNATKAKAVLGCTSCNETEGIFVGDVSEPETLKAVMAGADTLVITTSSVPVCTGSLPFPMKKCHYPKGGEPKEVDWLGTKAQIDAFGFSGGSMATKQLLYVSTMGTTTPDNFLDKLDKGWTSFYHLQAEADVMSSGIPFTIVKACGLGDGEPGKHKLLVGHDDASFSLAASHEIHREDVARVMVESILRLAQCRVGADRASPVVNWSAALPIVIKAARALRVAATHRCRAKMELFYFVLPAPNVEKSKAFFTKVFGWKGYGGGQGGHVDCTNTPCGLGGDVNEVYFTTLDLPKTLEKVLAHGGTIVKETENSVGKAAHCQDNQGVHLWFQEPSADPHIREHALNPKRGSANGDLFFFSMPAPEEAKALDFYGGVMGWTFDEKKAKGGMGVQNTVGPSGGLSVGNAKSQYPSLWFRVDSAEETLRLVKEAGGKGEIFEAPEGIMSQCEDDQGVEFGIVQPDIATDVLKAAHLPWDRPQVWNGILSSMFIGHALRKWVPQMSYEAQHLFCALFGVLHTMLGVSASKLEDYANREGSKMLHLAWAWSLKDVLSVMNMCQLGAAVTALSALGNEPSYAASFASGIALRIAVGQAAFFDVQQVSKHHQHQKGCVSPV
ncbi:SARED1 [Symbiodinium sp. KB8]|nr:SARED1 [Symbiodinium sp. KB8]